MTIRHSQLVLLAMFLIGLVIHLVCFGYSFLIGAVYVEDLQTMAVRTLAVYSVPLGVIVGGIFGGGAERVTKASSGTFWTAAGLSLLWNILLLVRSLVFVIAEQDSITSLFGYIDAVSAAIGRDQVLLEFVRFVPIDMKAVRGLDIPALSNMETGNVHYGVFVVSGATRKITAIDLGPAAAVDNAVLEYRRVQQSQSAPANFSLDEGKLAKAAESLKRLLIDPVAAQLRGVRRMYVAAEGQLSLLPFEAIPIAAAAGRPRYLVEDFEVVYLTTGRDLLQSGQTPETKRSREAWLFGDPDFDAAPKAVMAAVGTTSRASAPVETTAASSDAVIAETRLMGGGAVDDLSRWPRLKRTRDLIEKVSAAARASGMTPLTLTNAAASEPNATRMAKPHVVLFATHGKFLDRAPTIRFDIESLSIGPEGSNIKGLSEEEMLAADPLFRSMLVLAGANRSAQTAGDDAAGDGLLTAYEVWGLNLDGTELVALTACETGLGVVQGGASGGLRQPEGEVVAGLRQAFMVAGVRSMVMSMWPVPLGETANLFDHFFKGWLGKGEGRYTAFRRAQLDALAYAREKRGSGHPFWWAGFIFVGNADDVEREGSGISNRQQTE